MHQSVLLKEVIGLLDPKAGEFMIDGTVNGGGHAGAILEKIGTGTFLGIELDPVLFRAAQKSLFGVNDSARVILKNDNYANIPVILKSEKLPKADGLFLDLGFSSAQLEAGRGFSFLKNEPLDMRYGKEGEPAAYAVNSLSAGELEAIFRNLGEERYARAIAEEIVESRRKKRIITTFDLVGAIRAAVSANYERGRIHPATRVFQALRIYVNRELENLEAILKNLESILNPGGRAAVISFHSLEDRLVKNYFRNLAKSGKARLLNKKPITADNGELKSNPRARSAKLRGLQII